MNSGPHSEEAFRLGGLDMQARVLMRQVRGVTALLLGADDFYGLVQEHWEDVAVSADVSPAGSVLKTHY